MRLSDLDDEEFADEMQGALGNDARWASFLDGETLDRTHSALEVLHAKLTDQILRHGEGPNVNREWLSRARGLRALVLARVRQVDRLDESRTSREKKWKAFAHNLAVLVERSDMYEELDNMDAPFGDITAGEWLDRRREKRGQVAA